MQPLDREQLPRDRADMFLVSGVDLIAPLPRLAVQIFPTGESAPGKKVSLDEMERPFYARRDTQSTCKSNESKKIDEAGRSLGFHAHERPSSGFSRGAVQCDQHMRCRNCATALVALG